MNTWQSHVYVCFDKNCVECEFLIALDVSSVSRDPNQQAFCILCLKKSNKLMFIVSESSTCVQYLSEGSEKGGAGG